MWRQSGLSVVVLMILIIVALAPAAAQTAQKVAEQRLDAFSSLERELATLDDKIKAAFDVRRDRDRLTKQRNRLFGQYQRAALKAAEAFTVLAESAGTAEGSETALVRWYLIAKLFRAAGSCNDALPYYRRARDHTMFGDYEIGDRPLQAIVRAAVRRCGEAQVAGLRGTQVTYDGKAAYVLHKFHDRLTDSRPYTNADFEWLGGRVYALDQVNDAVEAMRDLSTTGTVLAKPPFLLVDGPGDYGEQSLRPEKIVPGDEKGRVGAPSRLAFLQNIHTRIVGPISTRLGQIYFNKAQPRYLIPLYLVGGKMNEDGLNGYVRFCLKVHFRSCGLRMGYFLPYDNSVLVWLATGGGTLSHEMTHALMEADFPNAPGWISEGLASLHEQLDSDFRPLDNYRYYYLRFTLDRFHRLIPLEKLLAISRVALNSSEEVKLIAAYSRYLNLYLWEKGVLVQVYKDVRDLPEPTVAAQVTVLKRHLGKSLAAIEGDWKAWFERRKEPQYWASLSRVIRQEVERLDAPPW